MTRYQLQTRIDGTWVPALRATFASVAAAEDAFLDRWGTAWDTMPEHFRVVAGSFCGQGAGASCTEAPRDLLAGLFEVCRDAPRSAAWLAWDDEDACAADSYAQRPDPSTKPAPYADWCNGVAHPGDAR